MSVSSSWRSAGEGVAIFASIHPLDAAIDKSIGGLAPIHRSRLAARTDPLCILVVLSGRCAGQRACTAALVNG